MSRVSLAKWDRHTVETDDFAAGMHEVFESQSAFLSSISSENSFLNLSTQSES